jgi:uncharacterized protein YbaP (TraB family)
MRRTAIAIIWALSMTLASASHAQAQSDSPPAADELEAVLVTGEQPGPGLWKVSKGDHVLWILGSHGPLPKGMRWRSNQVEARIAESQEVLYPGRLQVAPDVGFFRGITLLPALFKAGKNPDGAKLKGVLPADVYAKWLVLRKKYAGNDDDMEKWRPSIAVSMLAAAAQKKSGLDGAPRIESVVNKAAKVHKVRIHALPNAEHKVKVKQPGKLVKQVGKANWADAQCFSRSLDRLESDLAVMRESANAWSEGDVEKLRSLRRPASAEDNCGMLMLSAVASGSFSDEAELRELLKSFAQLAKEGGEELKQNWSDAVQQALARNQSTFAVLPIDTLLSPDGHLKRLRDLGYEVEEPQ